jgi:Family of unknown function (DUF6370)
MRIAAVLLLGLGLTVAFLGGANGADKGKEVTLKGTITCAKCDLKLEKKCATVIQVKAGDKTAVYYFDTAGNKKYHSGICTEAKPGSVTGTVAEKDGKKTITVTAVKFD